HPFGRHYVEYGQRSLTQLPLAQRYPSCLTNTFSCLFSCGRYCTHFRWLNRRPPALNPAPTRFLPKSTAATRLAPPWPCSETERSSFRRATERQTSNMTCP